MAIERIGTNASANLLLAQIKIAESRLEDSNRQVSTGHVSDNYAGYAGKTSALEGARTAAARADADIATAQEASRRLDLQDNLLGQLSDLGNNVRQAISEAAANGNGASLMSEMKGYYDQAVQILNAKDGDTYIFAGEKDGTPPVNAATLDDLAALPTASDAFDNGTVKRTIRIGQGQTVEVGQLASDLGTQLFSLFQSVAQFDQGANGPFGNQLTQSQSDFLTTNIKTAADAASDINVQVGSNGFKYKAVQDAMDHLQASSTIYKTLVSNIEDVDMTDAVSKLSQNQLAFQAALQVTAKLNQVSLLDFLPIT
jgi:flagellar hook-associated protein 3 FlgL